MYVERDINFAALLEYGKLHGHYNIPINETFECDIPAEAGETEIDVSTGIILQTVHYNGPLGYWLHDELRRLKSKKGLKAAKERHQFQELVNQGLLNQFEVDGDVDVLPAGSSRESEGYDHLKPRRERASNTEWNIVYHALLHYKE